MGRSRFVADWSAKTSGDILDLGSEDETKIIDLARKITRTDDATVGAMLTIQTPTADYGGPVGLQLTVT